jgi:hypothetical protein
MPRRRRGRRPAIKKLRGINPEEQRNQQHRDQAKPTAAKNHARSHAEAAAAIVFAPAVLHIVGRAKIIKTHGKSSWPKKNTPRAKTRGAQLGSAFYHSQV